VTRATLSPTVRYTLVVLLFAGAAFAFDTLVMSLVADAVIDLSMGLAQARTSALVIIVLVLCGGGVAGMVATAPLVGREIKDRDRSVQTLLYFAAVMVVPTIWLGASVIFLVLAFFLGLAFLAGFLFIERRVRGERLPIPTQRVGDRACPECGSMQVDLAPSVVAISGPPELVCFKCDHRWQEQGK